KERRMFISPEEWKDKYLPELNRLWGMKEAGIKPKKITEKPITAENIEDTLNKILGEGKGEFIGDAVTIYDEKLKIDPTFPEEKTIKEVSDIIDKITGGTAKIELVSTIPVSEEGLSRHGFKSVNLKNMKFTVLGRTRILSRNEFKSLIKLTYSHPEIEATAAHEGFHVASEMFLDKTKNNILKDYFSKGGKNWKETAADAFSDFYMKGKEGKESSTIKNIFNRISSFFSQLKNGLMGKGFNSVDSIFKEIATGKTAKEAIERKESDIKTKIESKPVDIDMLDSVKIEPKGLTEVIDVIKREGIRSKFEKRIREDMGKLGTYFASPYAVSKKYDKFKKAFDRFMYGTEVAEESLVKMLEMNKGYYSLNEGSKSKVGKVMIESDKNGKPFTTEELKKRGFNNEEISAYWANKKATDFTISERHRRIVKDSLLYDYQNEKWMDSYINDFLYGDHRQSLDSFKKKIESKLTKEEIKDMIEFHEKNPLVTERQVFERDNSGNIVVDENGKPKYTTKHLYDEISDLKGFLKSTYYFPRTYGDGKYFARVIQISPDGSKNTVWRNNTEWKILRKIEERDWSKAIDEGVRRANELNSKAKKGYKFVVEKGEIEESLTDIYPHITKEALTKFTESALLSIKEKGKVDPTLSKDFSSTLLDALHKDILARGSVTKHFIQREKYQTMSGEEAGVEGYKIDKPDQIYAQYFKQMANNFSKLSFTTPAYKMLSQIDVQMQPELYKYTKRWIQDMLTPGNKMDRAVSIFKHIAFGTYMGFNLRPAAIQMTQNLIGGLPILSRHIAEGLGKPKAHAQSDILAHNYMFKAAKDLAFNIKDIGKNNKLSIEEKMAMKELYQKGYTRAQYLNQLLGETMGKYGSRMQKFQSAMGWLFAQSEAYNRYTAGLARYRTARNIDKVSHNEAIRRAEGFISDVHFVYGVHNLPQIIRGQGVMPALGRMAYTFRSFTQYFVESMVNYGKDKEGKIALDVAFRSLAYMALLGGIAGLPFVDDVLDTYESKTGTPIREQIGNMFGNPDSVLRLGVENGLPAALLGIDISSSVQINIPKNPEDALVGVYGSIGDKFTKATQQLEYGNWARAVESMSPLFIENPLKAARMLKEGATTVTGSTRYQETGEPLKFSDTDALLQGMGLKPVELSRMQKVERISKNLENFYRKQRENIAARVRGSRDNLDMSDIMDRVNSYNEKAAKFNGAIPLITSKNFKSYLAEDKPNKTLLWLGMEANVNEEEKATEEETTNAE
ncbi:MAG: PLxRFG domain-containing protein, partial [Bacteroidetes bacterium]